MNLTHNNLEYITLANGEILDLRNETYLIAPLPGYARIDNVTLDTSPGVAIMMSSYRLDPMTRFLRDLLQPYEMFIFALILSLAVGVLMWLVVSTHKSNRKAFPRSKIIILLISKCHLARSIYFRISDNKNL